MLMFVKIFMGYCWSPACSIFAVAATLNVKSVIYALALGFAVSIQNMGTCAC